jgi:hypothetical protein
MQLLIRFDSHDRSAFRDAYDGAREEREQSGLTQLQLWEEADAPDRLWALFGVADRDKAEAWLARTSALGSHLEGHDAHFLATA